MTGSFENTALIDREPKPRAGQCCPSSLLFLGADLNTRAGAAPAFPKNASASGRKRPVLDGLSRAAFANACEQLVLRDVLPSPAPGADTVDPPRVLAPALRTPKPAPGVDCAEDPCTFAPGTLATEPAPGAGDAEVTRVVAPGELATEPAAGGGDADDLRTPTPELLGTEPAAGEGAADGPRTPTPELLGIDRKPGAATQRSFAPGSRSSSTRLRRCAFAMRHHRRTTAGSRRRTRSVTATGGWTTK